MSTDFSVKPVGAPVATPIVRPQPEAVKAAVATDLPSPKATTAQDPSSAARNDSQPSNSDLSYQIVIDRAAAEIVYRLVDSRTSAVVEQFPDEARLRLRAYQRALDEAKQNHTPVQFNDTT
jgi:hypothetical protein